jgi:hypothetical protein
MKYPKKYRRYPFKRQLKRKLRKIAFMIIIAALIGGTRYYGKYYDNKQLENNTHSTDNHQK